MKSGNAKNNVVTFVDRKSYYLNRGNLFYEAGNFNKAQYYFSKALEDDKDNLEIKWHLAVSLSYIERFAEANSLFCEMIEKGFEVNINKFILGQNYFALDDYQACVMCLQDFIENCEEDNRQHLPEAEEILNEIDNLLGIGDGFYGKLLLAEEYFENCDTNNLLKLFFEVAGTDPFDQLYSTFCSLYTVPELTELVWKKFNSLWKKKSKCSETKDFHQNATLLCGVLLFVRYAGEWSKEGKVLKIISEIKIHSEEEVYILAKIFTKAHEFLIPYNWFVEYEEKFGNPNDYNYLHLYAHTALFAHKIKKSNDLLEEIKIKFPKMAKLSPWPE